MGRSAIVKRLVDARASTEVKDRGGRTTLDLAQDCAKNGEERSLRSLTISDDIDSRRQHRIIVSLREVVSQPRKPSGLPIGGTSSARILKAGVPGLSSTFPLLTSWAEILVDRFSKTGSVSRPRLIISPCAQKAAVQICPEQVYLDTSR
jgi:hypothetical protein